VVGAYLGGTPQGDFVGLTVPSTQGPGFPVQEELQGLRAKAGGPVDAQSGHVAIPTSSFVRELARAPEITALEKRSLAYWMLRSTSDGSVVKPFRWQYSGQPRGRMILSISVFPGDLRFSCNSATYVWPNTGPRFWFT